LAAVAGDIHLEFAMAQSLRLLDIPSFFSAERQHPRAHFPGRHQRRSRNQVGSDAGRSTPASFSSPNIKRISIDLFPSPHGLQAYFFQPWPNAPHHCH
jgi:hypothetical protein